MSGETCKQEPQLRLINERWIDLEREMRRMAEALETLAAQRVEIEHLTEQQRDTRKWVKDHENRIQSLERAPGYTASKFLWIVVGASVTVGPGVATGLILWLLKGAS